MFEVAEIIERDSRSTTVAVNYLDTLIQPYPAKRLRYVVIGPGHEQLRPTDKFKLDWRGMLVIEGHMTSMRSA